MRALVTNAKLRSISDVQQADITTLSGELARLQRRSYPLFDEAALLGHSRAAGGDERIPALPPAHARRR